jgi:predicted ATPase/class 3 adenylate cyclase
MIVVLWSHAGVLRSRRIMTAACDAEGNRVPKPTTLPTGTVTFLFTDIEGSTLLLQALADRYDELLSEHCRIIRAAIADGGGTEVGTEGDSFFVAFPNAPRAIAAAVAAQRTLAAQAWPAGAEVRVRMGIHTGEGRRGGDNYIGLDVHRAARIAAAGYGGQVVVSDATRTLVEQALPEGVRLRDLGPHRLKDLAQPEHLFQLEIDGLAGEFPPLRTLDARPNNLPAQLSSFVGREAEIAAVGDLLERTRLITLTGPGGTGKTRLALQIAAKRLSRYADGVFFVELAAISDPGLVPSAVASALDVREITDQPLDETLKSALRDREMLLVLDNFEQVVDAAPLTTELLQAAHRVRILVTSRSVLHVRGEQEYPVPALKIPDPARLPSLEALSQYEGVALFVERAAATRPNFSVTNDSAPAIAEIVARLDGLPLAIELAAAKTRLLSPAEIIGRLGSRLSFLAGGPRDVPARQQTLRQAIDWSYGLLPANEQAFFRSLGVFVAGWTLEAAEAVCSPAELGLEALDALSSLQDQSLVRRGEAAPGDPRFEMLETIREYALDQLSGAAEAVDVRRRHAQHYLAVAQAAEPELTRSPEAIARVAADHDNFRAALAWAIETDDAELGLLLGFALWRFWHQRAYLREGRQWFTRLLALPHAAPRTTARAKGLTGAAGIAYWQNDYPAAEGWYLEAESIFRELGDRRALGDAIYNVASMAAIRGDIKGAMALGRESSAIAREIGDDAMAARSIQMEGYGAFMLGDLDTARPLLDEGLERAIRTGDRFGIGGAHHTVGQVARLQGRLGDATDHYRQAIQILHELGDEASLTEPLQGLAAVSVATGDPARGVRILAANSAIRERLGGGPPPEWLQLGDPLEEARMALGEMAYAAAWESGTAMTTDEAVREAVRE